MFPLNTVLFPGMRMPLYVFEARYQRLVEHLLTEPEPRHRLLGTVAIRSGYEVGDHGAQTLHTTGCLLQLTEVEDAATGGYRIEVLARQRLRLVEMETDGFPVGQVDLLDDEDDDLDLALREMDLAKETFRAYRDALSRLQGEPTIEGSLGNDPAFLSYALAATCLLGLHQRQELLEAPTAGARLRLLRGMLRQEIAAMQALPSLPAVEVARTGWSPN